MTDSVSFKAYLKRDGQEVEVRRFGVDGGASTSYVYLRSKIEAVFPSLQNDQFQLFWQDSDNDYIRVDSDEELFEALTSSNQQPLKLYIHVQSTSSQGGSTGRQTHQGVVCDGCEGGVTGNRYKCVTCPDYDLCSTCEGKGLHPEHFMLRMPATMDVFRQHPKFVRKMFSHPHKFYKRHGWARMAPPRGCGDSQPGAGRCPYSRRGESHNPTAGLPGVTDMFDFSALMDFIEGLGVATGEHTGASANANASASTNEASSSSNETPNSSQSQANQQERPQQRNGGRQGNSPAAEYLTNIGQMVAAVLNPLGVDVTFDVRTKPSQSQEANGPSQSTSQDLPTTTQTPPVAQTPPAQTPPTAPQDPSTTYVVPPTTAQAASMNPPPEVPSSQAEAVPPTTTGTVGLVEQIRERRNSDDWTLLNRESPIRGDVTAMDVDESRAPKPKTSLPSAIQDTASPSAPPHSNDVQEIERKKIQDAIETFRSMGFNFDTALLHDLLQRQNCDIASVLEMILNISGKK